MVAASAEAHRLLDVLWDERAMSEDAVTISEAAWGRGGARGQVRGYDERGYVEVLVALVNERDGTVSWARSERLATPPWRVVPGWAPPESGA